MPPQRTLPPAKAVKTERTHEENQERAYIAASRRSDRSLEARVESARRASEIHKKRTGRSLRVTEQDVVNEEMYEEEDDDLPMQYRRLTAHLQTGSADFNRRLAAYLANAVAMRSAIDQAITNSYAQQYPNAPQFAHNQQTMYPSGMMAPGMAMGMQPQQMHQQQQQQPQQRAVPPSSHPYRQNPYPMPGAAGYRQHAHNRSSSVAQTFDLSDYPQNSPIAPQPQAPIRRMSMPAPATSMSPATPTSSRSSLPQQTSQQVIAQKRASYPTSDTESSTPVLSATTQSMGPRSTTSSLPSAQHTPQPQTQALPHAQTQAPAQPMPPPTAPFYNLQAFPDYGFFSTSLPPESQMLLGSTLNPNDPLTPLLMSGSENYAHAFYPNNLYNNFNPANMMLKDPTLLHPSYDGMSATLAPSALSMSPSQPRNIKIESSGADVTPPPSFSYGSDVSLSDYKGINFNVGQSGSGHDSGTATPGLDGGWDAFINDNPWTENGT